MRMHALGSYKLLVLLGGLILASVCLPNLVPQGDHYWQGGPILAAKIGLGGLILAAKIGPGGPILV